MIHIVGGILRFEHSLSTPINTTQHPCFDENPKPSAEINVLEPYPLSSVHHDHMRDPKAVQERLTAILSFTVEEAITR